MTAGDSPSRPVRRDLATGRTKAEREGVDENSFADGSLDRRTFISLSAGALAPPITRPGDGDVSDTAMTDLCEFVLANTRDGYEAAVVIEFADDDSLAAFAARFEEEPDPDLGRPAKAVTRDSPTPAAHAHLTADEVADVLEAGGVDLVDFSPGSNPFWKLEDPYADGVFPPVEEARDWIAHREAVRALDHLEEAHGDRVRVRTYGRGAGFENRFTGDEPDRRSVWVVETTNDVDDESTFRGKDKVVFAMGIHGDERPGVETGCRIIEEIAAGDADDFDPLLDDIVVVWLFHNPDGWVVRTPQYEHPLTDEHGDDGAFYGFYNHNANGLDPNRQYPTIGWINPAHYPADPEDAPEEYRDAVPEVLASVEQLRRYDNVEYLCDYHGMEDQGWFAMNLESNATYDHEEAHALDEVNRRIGGGMEDRWGSVDAIRDDVDRIAEERFGGTPSGNNEEGLFTHGSTGDLLWYQITGGLASWAGQSEERGGLGAVTVVPELSWANTAGIEPRWRPYAARHQYAGYRIEMRECARTAAADTRATVTTGDRDGAYVTSDELTRSSADLSHADERSGDDRNHGGRDDADGGGRRSTEVRRRSEAVRPGPSGRVAVRSRSSTRSLAIRFRAPDVDEGIARVTNPDGEIAHEIDLVEAAGSPCCRSDDDHFYEANPTAGTWRIESHGAAEVDVDLVVTDGDEEHPDPEAVLGYAQREYEVNPMRFFADLDSATEDGSMDGLSVDDVRAGALGSRSDRRYDKLVVSHDDGIDEPQYVSAIEAFVDGGGDLVCTDAGLSLLAVLDVGATGDIDAAAVDRGAVDVTELRNRDFDHPLLADVREPQTEIWKGSQVGYTTGDDSPIWTVDSDAFEAAGGTVAGTLGNPDGVALGTLPAGDSEINVIGSILPPANQSELHPFGMADYALTFLGRTLVCNALGFQQRRYDDDELVATFGEIR